LQFDSPIRSAVVVAGGVTNDQLRVVRNPAYRRRRAGSENQHQKLKANEYPPNSNQFFENSCAA